MNNEKTCQAEPPAATRNACKLCAPLGASLVFKGIRNCIPFLHGSQGCATYIRRYMISHFREPVDIASSSFSEDDAIFGGARNFTEGVNNVIRQYHPEVIGVATTCLSETIGENMIAMIKTYQDNRPEGTPPLVHVSTPAYTGTHADGFVAAIREVVQFFANHSDNKIAGRVNLIPSIMSCSDLRHLRDLCTLFGLNPTILPDYSQTLEGESWDSYHRISPGGTPADEIATMGQASATLEFGHYPASLKKSAGSYLESSCRVPKHSLGWPMGVRLTDQFMDALEKISGKPMPERLHDARGRLVDAYVDAHKYISGKKAVIFGEPDLVVALAAFLSEIGIRPIICATGSKIKGFQEMLASEIEGGIADVEALGGADHAKICARARELKPDLILGSSKGYPLARELDIPLVRIGFPIHDRFGAQRMLSVGYEGSLELFDRIVNAMLETKQDNSKTGYSYL